MRPARRWRSQVQVREAVRVGCGFHQGLILAAEQASSGAGNGLAAALRINKHVNAGTRTLPNHSEIGELNQGLSAEGGRVTLFIVAAGIEKNHRGMAAA